MNYVISAEAKTEICESLSHALATGIEILPILPGGPMRSIHKKVMLQISDALARLESCQAVDLPSLN